MSERDASIVAAALFVVLGMVPTDPGQTIEMRRGRIVMCGDCGPSNSIHDACQFCGGFALPIARTNLKGGTSMATTRPAPLTKKRKIVVKK